MSTYAVFGMTESRALAEATKKTPAKPGGIEIPESEWLQNVRKHADDLMKSKKKPRLSPLFDAPQFAREFMAIAMRERHRDLHIKAYAPDKDAQGNPIKDKKTGKVKMRWQAVK